MPREMTEYEKKVRIAMTERGIKNYSELAEQVGISRSYVHDIVYNNRKATDMRQKFNDFLGLDGE